MIEKLSVIVTFDETQRRYPRAYTARHNDCTACGRTVAEAVGGVLAPGLALKINGSESLTLVDMQITVSKYSDSTKDSSHRARVLPPEDSPHSYRYSSDLERSSKLSRLGRSAYEALGRLVMTYPPFMERIEVGVVNYTPAPRRRTIKTEGDNISQRELTSAPGILEKENENEDAGEQLRKMQDAWRAARIKATTLETQMSADIDQWVSGLVSGVNTMPKPEDLIKSRQMVQEAQDECRRLYDQLLSHALSCCKK